MITFMYMVWAIGVMFTAGLTKANAKTCWQFFGHLALLYLAWPLLIGITIKERDTK